MAQSLTSSIPFHLPNAAARRRQARFPKPFISAKKQGGGGGGGGEGEEGVSSSKGGFFSDINGKFSDIAANVKSLVPAVVGSSSPATSLLFAGRKKRKDPNTVFVAGATGQAGVRIAQTLLREGFVVRAGVPDLESAQELARLAATYKVISPEEAKRLNAVESSFDDPEAIAKSIGNAAKLVVTIGPNENGPSAGVTTSNALEVVKAAELAGVGHVAVVYDTSRPVFAGGSTYNILDGITLFFDNLFPRSRELSLTDFLLKVVETDVSYTLIKASLTDDIYADQSSGIVVYPEGAAPAPAEVDDFKVSKSKIASLVAGVFANMSVTENKVVEVCASPSAASKSIDELFSSIPMDGRRNTYKEERAKARAEEEARKVSEKAQEAANIAKKLEKDAKELSKLGAQAANLAEDTLEEADTTGSSLKDLFSMVNTFKSEISWNKLSSQLEEVKKLANSEPKVQVATVRGQAKARSLPSRKAGFAKAAPPKRRTREQPDTKPEIRKAFGGLFKQETIYMDDD